MVTESDDAVLHAQRLGNGPAAVRAVSGGMHSSMHMRKVCCAVLVVGCLLSLIAAFEDRDLRIADWFYDAHCGWLVL
jgi:hypothetical protein